MTKNRIFALILLGCSLVLGVSCNQDEPDYGASSTKPVISVESDSYSVNEGEEVVITLTSDFAFNDDISFNLSIVEGTATDHEDFELIKSDAAGSSLDHFYDPSYADYAPYEMGDPDQLSYAISFPKGETSYTFKLSAILDELIEDQEYVTLKLTAAGNFNGTVNPEASTFTVNIINKKSDIVYFVGGWDRTFDFMGDTYSLCEIGYDMDFLYADSEFNLVDYFGSYDQCPETAEVSISEWGDGTWHIFNTVYSDASLSSAGITPTFKIPVTLDYNRPGSTLSGSYVQTDDNAYDSDSPSDPTVSDVRYVYSFTIDTATNTVTVFDVTTGQEIGTGRHVKSPGSKPVLKGLNRLAKRK